MQLYSENKDYKLYQGNMLDILEVIEPNSIDSIVTDPPYELNFMSKGWDNAGVSFQKETWQKCYEVLKPGGYLLAFGGSRTFHRIACAIEDAGFEIRDTIMWLYGSGFPKSMDISKQLDKRAEENKNIIFQKKEFKNYLNKKRKEKKYSLADINNLMGLATNGGGFASSIMGEKEKIEIPTKENYLKLKQVLDLDDKYDHLIEDRPSNYIEAKRETIGKGKAGLTKGTIANFAGATEFDITAPSTDLAKQWQGWGTALKPSFEPIIVARKPFKGSLVDNVIEYGVGGINIDECRVEPTQEYLYGKGNEHNKTYANNYKFNSNNLYIRANPNEAGRFPANTILTYDETDFEEVCGGFPYTKCGARKKQPYDANKNLWNKMGGGDCEASEGLASRYFYCAKASKRDRDEGLDEFKNIHPTVKPTNLMQYLIRLVTPNGGTILDPFNGSGSTGKAVMYENFEHNKNYKYIGIEITEEYLPIAKARIEYVYDLPKEDAQMNIFDYEGVK